MSATENKTRKQRRTYSARQKAEVVLALWTGRRRIAEVCRGHSLQATLVSNWQNRAMEGMLSALEPRTRDPEDQGPMLPDNLEKLLLQQSERRTGKIARLVDRLEKIQRGKEKTAAPTSS